MIQVLDGAGIDHDPSLLNLVRARAAEAGIKVVGDIVVLPTLIRGRKVQLYGWEQVAAWVAEKVNTAVRQPNLAEIYEGKRIGTPTLCRDDAWELAVGLASPGKVSWRNRRV